VADAGQVHGAATDCAAVVHLAGIVSESPPEATFERVNVEGTRNIVREAERAQAVRLVYVSSLGADRGSSAYQTSKREGERIALASPLNTTVLRLANVYGPGDEVISLLIKLVRVMPVVPAVDGGDDEFQPIWAGDAAQAIAACVERTDLGGRALDVAGPERTCMNDLIARVRDLTGKSPVTVSMPGSMVVLGARLASVLGVDVPLDTGQITMLEEGNVIPEGGTNALTEVLGVEATGLHDGLNRLADALPEQLPDQGVGSLRRKRVWADITGCQYTAESLFERFRTHFSDVTPWTIQVGAEPGTPGTPTDGETLTMAIPLRGNVQVRVEELTPRTMTLVTLEGHPLTGGVRFLSEQRGEHVRFEVQVYDRAANVADWLVMNTVGHFIQLGTWKSIVRRMVAESGGSADDIQTDVVTLDDAEAQRVEAWLHELVTERKRDDAPRAS
jgi:NADH dehydrogenase